MGDRLPETMAEWQEYIDGLRGAALWSKAVNANTQLFADILLAEGFKMDDVRGIVTMFAERLLVDDQRLPEHGAYDMRSLV